MTCGTAPGTSRRRWAILALGLAAQSAACCFLYGLPFLVPAIRSEWRLSLGQVGAVVGAPTIGLLLTLIAWGAAADRFGERRIMSIGLATSGLLVALAVPVGGVLGFAVVLGLAGAAGGSVNAASGRMVMGWFTAGERGLAMGIRQTAQPLGVGIAALSLPPLAEQAGFRAALLLPAALCVTGALLVAVFAIDPARSPANGDPRTPSPYRTATLWRLHAASAMLVAPQFAISAFSMEYLVSVGRWSAVPAGGFLALVQFAGALGRLGAGRWSDLVGSRLRPMRQLAVASAAVMLFAAFGAMTWPWLVVLALAVGAVVTVADNGLGFTSTAEIAGSAWAGRALGAQNTAQNIAAALTPPLLGLLIGGADYGVAFACVAVCPVLAFALTPVKAEAAATTGQWVRSRASKSVTS